MRVLRKMRAYVRLTNHAKALVCLRARVFSQKCVHMGVWARTFYNFPKALLCLRARVL
jgi:hypothetical protein